MVGVDLGGVTTWRNSDKNLGDMADGPAARPPESTDSAVTSG